MNNNRGKSSARREITSEAQAYAVAAAYQEKQDERRKQGVRSALKRKRDRQAAALAQAGYDSSAPVGLFGY